MNSEQIQPDCVCQHGFTLVELLVTIAIATILAVAALPVVDSIPANARIKDRGDRIIAQLQMARSEAIRTNKITYLCALNAKSNLQVQGCNTGETSVGSGEYSWAQGTMIYADTAVSGKPTKYDSGEHISHVVFDGKAEILAHIEQIAFLPSGRTRGAKSVSFVIRDKKTESCRTVRMDASGRARVCRPEESCNEC